MMVHRESTSTDAECDLVKVRVAVDPALPH